MVLEKRIINALRWIIPILESKQIPYTISGGFAAALYGSPRHVNDIDIDIPDSSVEMLYKEVKQYVIYGPSRYIDKKWNLILMTLNYKGQEIDIGGADTAKITNKDRTEWIKMPADFSNTNKIEIENLVLYVIKPSLLIAYKSNLDGDHQIEDINSIKKYLN